MFENIYPAKKPKNKQMKQPMKSTYIDRSAPVVTGQSISHSKQQRKPQQQQSCMFYLGSIFYILYSQRTFL